MDCVENVINDGESVTLLRRFPPLSDVQKEKGKSVDSHFFNNLKQNCKQSCFSLRSHPHSTEQDGGARGSSNYFCFFELTLMLIIRGSD